MKQSDAKMVAVSVEPSPPEEIARRLRDLASDWLEWYERDRIAHLFMSALLLLEAADYIERQTRK